MLRIVRAQLAHLRGANPPIPGQLGSASIVPDDTPASAEDHECTGEPGLPTN